MNSLFRTDVYRGIHIANQNRFPTPIKHPSRTLSEHIISYVCRGGWVLTVNGERICATADCIFIQPANVPHVGLEKCVPDTHTLFVHFDTAPEDRTPCTEDDVREGFLSLPHLLHVQSRPEVKKLLLQIIEEHTKENAVKASAYLNILLAELSECSESDGSRESLYRGIKQMIDAAPDKNFSNLEIAARLGVSVRYAETVFKEQAKTTIHRYQLSCKLQKARFFLEYYPSMTIMEIALSLGFYDEYHFSRCFKKELGLSPTAYRNTHRKTIDRVL